MRVSDWSSDVCSSDLGQHRVPARHRARGLTTGRSVEDQPVPLALARPLAQLERGEQPLRGGGDLLDGAVRSESVVKGQSVTVRVDLGGLRILQTTNA